MKFLRTAVVALFVSAAFTACKKDDVTPVFTIEGSWTGKIGTGSSVPSGQYALNIKAGGVIERISSNGSVSATGTWQLEGNNFTATYNYPGGTIVNIAGTVDKAINKISADWSNNGGEQGTLYANKQ
jgi:hypothetical protein